MVTFNNAGRLGNYLYECACAWAYAKKHNLEFTIPHNDRDPAWCPIYLHHLKNDNYDTNLEEVRIWENGHHYQELSFEEEWRDKNIIIEGYRQSWKYFDWCKKAMFKEWGLPYEMNKGVCSVHIRRGDYLMHPTRHPVVSDKYIFDAINEVCKRNLSTIKFLVFSDDIDYCKSLFNHIGGIEYEFSENNDPLTDLILMANCEHNIIANSTMSAWGAELNRNPHKIVVSPSIDNWFGIDNKHLDITDLYRPEWLQIKY